MKIVLITTLYPSYEGQSTKEISYALHYFVSDWKKMGHDVKVMKIIPTYPSIFERLKKPNGHRTDGTFQLQGIDVHRLTIKKFPRIDYFDKEIRNISNKILHEFNTSERPDIIVCHMINPAVYISTILKERLNIPIVLTIHQTDLFQLNKYKRRLKKFGKIVPYINKIGFRNQRLIEKYHELHLPSQNHFIVQSGIDGDIIISDDKLKEKIHSQSNVIFIAASMIPLKNIDIVMKAFKKMDRKEDVMLKIAGDGPEKNNLTKLARELEISDRVEFLGHIPRDSVLENMEKSDLFVMVSSPETFGLVYIEAMSKACLTIGSRGEGIDGVIKDHVNGFLCEPRNVDELSSKLSKALQLPKEEKERIMTAAVNTAKNMTQEKMSQRYLEILEDTIHANNQSKA